MYPEQRFIREGEKNIQADCRFDWCRGIENTTNDMLRISDYEMNHYLANNIACLHLISNLNYGYS